MAKSHVPSKPPVPPTPPAVPPAPVAKPAELNLPKIGGELQRLIADIAVQCKTSLQSTLLSYQRFASRAFKDHGDSDFPRTIRRHVRDEDRSQEPGIGNLLCFHVGNTILAYHQALQGKPAHHLQARLEHLREIKTLGVDAFIVAGSHAEGFMLLTPAAAKGAEEAKGVPTKAKREE